MDVNLINPFINATINVLETMAHIRCRVEKPYLKKDSVAKGEVTSVIGLTGAAACAFTEYLPWTTPKANRFN